MSARSSTTWSIGLVELLVIAARRPASQCINHGSPFASRARFYASNQTPLPQGRPTVPGKASSSKTHEVGKVFAPPAKALDPSMHIGLDRNPANLSGISRIPIPKGERGEDFKPSILSRPLGLQYPPEPGQNCPVDTRSLAQKKADFENYDNVLGRRKVLLRTFLRPYFQEWRRLDYYKGKSFGSNSRLFKREKALFFPNMWGRTLSKAGDGPHGGADTTPALRGKISIVGIQSGVWAEEQVDTFLSKKTNPELYNIVQSEKGLVQRADINVQAGWTKTMIVKLFRGRLRKLIPEEQWRRYFIVRLARDVGRGLTDDIRDAMGMLNSQVGYVYLLDSECRIRWAGSGHAWPGEADGLNACIKRLVEEELQSGYAKRPASYQPPRKTRSQEKDPERGAITLEATAA